MIVIIATITPTTIIIRGIPSSGDVTGAGGATVGVAVVVIALGDEKTGDPNGGINVTWPQYTSENGKYLDINETMTIKSD